MSIIRTSVLNGVAVAIKVSTAIILNKILAMYVGPAGYALIGQFQNVVAMTLLLAGGVLVQGITKGTAEHSACEKRQHAIWRTATNIAVCATLVTSVTLILSARSLSQQLLHRPDMESIFFVLAITLPAVAANTLVLGAINGKKDVGTYVGANIIGNLVSAITIGALTYFYGLYGALLALAIAPATFLLSTATLVWRRAWFKTRYFFGKVDRATLRELLGFGLMGTISAITAPLTYIYIRHHLSETLSLSAAGYWQASWKISEIYLMLVTATLSVYYLPRLAEIKLANELKREIIKVYSLVLPITVAGALSIYILRDLIISSLFSKDFTPMQVLFQWQLTGDILKIGAWILAYVMLGRAMIKPYVWTEIAFSLSFCLLTVWFVKLYGLQGVSVAYAFNYFFYWIVIGVVVKSEIKTMRLTPVAQ